MPVVLSPFCAQTGDWSGIGGDPVKFCLGIVSMVFDVIMLLQHYVWYRAPVGTHHASKALYDEVQSMLR